MCAMKIAVSLLLFCALASAQGTAGQRFLNTEREAFQAFEKKDWARAVALFEKQAAILPASPRPFYNIACCYGLQGDGGRAASWLRLAVAHGWRDLAWALKDTDLAAVREHPEFQASLAHLRATLKRDPDPLPLTLAPQLAPRVTNAAAIFLTFSREEQAVRTATDYLEPGQIRRAMFPLFDRKMAALTRYVLENGDAPDADVAGYFRVRTAVQYLESVDPGRAADVPLHLAAAALVVRTAGEFYYGWPGSPMLPEVRLLHAEALPSAVPDGRAEGESILRGLARDYPDKAIAVRALLTLLRDADASQIEQVTGDYRMLIDRYGDSAIVKFAIQRGSVGRARLLVEGLPKLVAADPEEKRVEPFDGGAKAVLLILLETGDEVAAKQLASLRELQSRFGERGLRIVVLALGDPDRRWLDEHAAGLLRAPSATEYAGELRLRIPSLPYRLLCSGDGKPLAFGPTEAELKKRLDQLLR